MKTFGDISPDFAGDILVQLELNDYQLVTVTKMLHKQRLAFVRDCLSLCGLEPDMQIPPGVRKNQTTLMDYFLKCYGKIIPPVKVGSAQCASEAGSEQSKGSMSAAREGVHGQTQHKMFLGHFVHGRHQAIRQRTTHGRVGGGNATQIQATAKFRSLSHDARWRS